MNKNKQTNILSLKVLFTYQTRTYKHRRFQTTPITVVTQYENRGFKVSIELPQRCGKAQLHLSRQYKEKQNHPLHITMITKCMLSYIQDVTVSLFNKHS